jgi:hypothetical protein
VEGNVRGPNLRQYSGIYLDVLRKTMKTPMKIISVQAEIRTRYPPPIKVRNILLKSPC